MIEECWTWTRSIHSHLPSVARRVVHHVEREREHPRDCAAPHLVGLLMKVSMEGKAVTMLGGRFTLDASGMCPPAASAGVPGLSLSGVPSGVWCRVPS